MANDERLLIPLPEAARLLSIRPETIYRLVREGTIPAVQVNPGGRLLRVPMSALRQIATPKSTKVES